MPRAVRGRRLRQTPGRATRPGRPQPRPRRPRPGYRRYERAARGRLRRFRQAGALAIALTGLLLIVWESPDLAGQTAADTGAAAAETTVATAPADPAASLQQATGTVNELWRGFFVLLPRIGIAILLIVLAMLIAALVGAVGRRVVRHWERAAAFTALARLALVLVALGAGLSVIAGDARALVGSLGLAGLALSWALQNPIESFSGWVLNAFRGYYRHGDRIEVGDVFGDVYRIDILTTTVWEAGGPGKSVAGAQPTGSLVTFPNGEILRSSIVNYTRDFPYVWDELSVGVANESDLRYTMEVLERVADRVVGQAMQPPVERYRDLLERARLGFDVETRPKAFLSLTDSWTNCTIRYLVPARQRRRWASELILAVAEETARPEHRGRIVPSYPRQIVQLAGAAAAPGAGGRSGDQVEGD